MLLYKLIGVGVMLEKFQVRDYWSLLIIPPMTMQVLTFLTSKTREEQQRCTHSTKS